MAVIKNSLYSRRFKRMEYDKLQSLPDCAMCKLFRAFLQFGWAKISTSGTTAKISNGVLSGTQRLYNVASTSMQRHDVAST